MEPPAYWAKIAVDLPDPIPGSVPQINDASFIFSWYGPGHQLTEFCRTLGEVLPDPESSHFDRKWVEFNAFRSPLSVFCHRLKFIKKQAAWAIRQGSHRLQAWVQAEDVIEDGESVEDLWLYIAADTQDDFEFIVRTVRPCIDLSLLQMHGARDSEFSPLAIHNPTFCSVFTHL